MRFCCYCGEWKVFMIIHTKSWFIPSFHLPNGLFCKLRFPSWIGWKKCNKEIELLVDHSEICQWDLWRLQLRFFPAYSASQAVAMHQMCFFEMLLFWFSGISCLLFFLFYISCNSFFICWKTVKKWDLWNSLLYKLKIYILVFCV